MTPEANDQPEPQKPARRRRYRGTHPRQFAQRYKELDPAAYPEMAGHIQAQGRTPAGSHVPIMVAEVLAALNPQPGEVAADVTLGHGGHARELLRRVGPAGVLVGLDVDAAELERTRGLLEQEFPGPRIKLARKNFAGLKKVLAAEGLRADVVLADLGVSSMQLDDPQRGFSYKQDGPLDLQMDQRRPETAADLLGRIAEAKLGQALRELADEPDHAAIARAIVQAREAGPLTRTRQLVEIVLRAKGISPQSLRQRRQRGESALHPAARTFQVLRILVNDELTALATLLRDAPALLAPAGRIGVITFHSGEDRLVKASFLEFFRQGIYQVISPEPMRPTPGEIHANPRSRGAKFRWAKLSADL